MINPNWPRWVFASVSKHFIDIIEATDTKVYVEGDDRNTNEFKTFIEFRMDGPTEKRLTKIESDLRIEISLLVTTMKDDKDAHILERYIGNASLGFTTGISVFRFGDSPDPENPLFEGCLTLETESKRALIISKFGLVQTDLPVLQATLNAFYSGRFVNKP